MRQSASSLRSNTSLLLAVLDLSDLRAAGIALYAHYGGDFTIDTIESQEPPSQSPLSDSE